MKNNKYKILLVEDDGNIRTVIAALLETSDYQVIQAETGAMAETLFSSYQRISSYWIWDFRIWMEWNLFLL